MSGCYSCVYSGWFVSVYTWYWFFFAKQINVQLPGGQSHLCALMRLTRIGVGRVYMLFYLSVWSPGLSRNCRMTRAVVLMTFPAVINSGVVPDSLSDVANWSSFASMLSSDSIAITKSPTPSGLGVTLDCNGALQQHSHVKTFCWRLLNFPLVLEI